MAIPPAAFDIRPDTAIDRNGPQHHNSLRSTTGSREQATRLRARLSKKPKRKDLKDKCRAEPISKQSLSTPFEVKPLLCANGETHPHPLFSNPCRTSRDGPALPSPSRTSCEVRSKLAEEADKQARSGSRRSLSTNLAISLLPPTFAADAHCLPPSQDLTPPATIPATPPSSTLAARTKAIMDLDRLMIKLRSRFNIHVKKGETTLLSLSSKIRERIHSQVLMKETMITVCPCTFCAGEGTIQPPITQVCRQLRKETLPIFYGHNRFSFPDAHRYPDGVNSWLRAIGSQNRLLLTHLTVPTYNFPSAINEYGLLNLELAHPQEDRILSRTCNQHNLICVTFRGARSEAEAAEADETSATSHSSMETTATSIFWREDIWDSEENLMTQPALLRLKETHTSNRFSSRDIIQSMIARTASAERGRLWH